MPTDRAQDTEAIRAARLDGLVAQIWDAYRDDAYGSSFQMKVAAYWPELAAERGRLVARLEAAERDRDEWKRLLFVAREWGEKLDRHCNLVYAELDRALGGQAPKAWERIEAALAAATPGDEPCTRCGATPETGLTEGCPECEGIVAAAAPGETEQTP